MGIKSNIKSFRYSDEVAAILEGFGSKDASFNSKFEDLVLYCYYKLPELDKEIKLRQKHLDAINVELRESQRKIYDNRALWVTLDRLMADAHALQVRLSAAAEKL